MPGGKPDWEGVESRLLNFRIRRDFSPWEAGFVQGLRLCSENKTFRALGAPYSNPNLPRPEGRVYSLPALRAWYPF